VLELGVGPGYLAERLLARVPDITYQGLDFSEPMLGIASKRLSNRLERIHLTKGDLLGDTWVKAVQKPIGAIVSTWALHDLGGESQIAKVYRGVKSLLPENALFLNGDLVKPDGTRLEFEPGRITVARHLELFTEIGFRESKCLQFFEKELENPTAAQNYACLLALG
jgi:cyclopropane fatty-acyl-phospholipid synthase-like methyltransferase